MKCLYIRMSSPVRNASRHRLQRPTPSKKIGLMMITVGSLICF